MQVANSFRARCALAAASGAAYSLAFPPLGWGWLAIPGLAGLILVLQGQHGTRARALGFLHGMAAYGIGLSWMFEIFGFFVVVLWFVLAAFHALFAEMQSRAVIRGLGGWALAAFTAANWAGWEFIRAELFPLKFPWMTAGLAMGPNALLPWIGVYAAGSLLVFVTALACGRLWKPAVLLGCGLIASVVFFRKLPVPSADDPQTVKVGGVQLESVTLEDYIKHTRTLPDDVSFVVWPEYAIPYDIRKNARDWKLAGNLCAERNITLTFGTQEVNGENGWRNIALTMNANGVRGIHNKVHTVHFFDDGIPGITADVIETDHGKIGTPICFDCDYEGIVRRMTVSGAQLFMVPVMDAISWTRRQHDQHAELFRIRAAENGRWMFVCATSGVSMAIDPHGHLHGRLGALEQGTLVASVKREKRITGYTRFGWLAPWMILGVAALGWLKLLLPVKKKAGGAANDANIPC